MLSIWDNWKVVWGGANALFFHLQESQVSFCEGVKRPYSLSLLVSTYLYPEIQLQPELSPLLSGLVLVGGWMCTVGNMQPTGLVAWDKPHSNGMCLSTRVLMPHLNPSFFLIYQHVHPLLPHFLPKQDFLVVPLFLAGTMWVHIQRYASSCVGWHL